MFVACLPQTTATGSLLPAAFSVLWMQWWHTWATCECKRLGAMGYGAWHQGTLVRSARCSSATRSVAVGEPGLGPPDDHALAGPCSPLRTAERHMRIVDAGGVRCVLAAMESHMGTLTLQRCGLLVLTALATEFAGAC